MEKQAALEALLTAVENILTKSCGLCHEDLKDKCNAPECIMAPLNYTYAKYKEATHEG